MGLLDSVLNRNKKQDESENIVAILFRQNEGVGYLCHINHTQQSVDILDERAFKYSNAWENLVYDIDELLFNFENIHNLKLTKATFFVYSHLVDTVTGQLKEPYVQSLKTVISENKLDSLGYIELEESLAQVYTKIEQSPLNAVLVEVDTSSVSVFVYKGGQKSFANTIAKTENLTEDLEELFKRTEKGMLLPARILMYDSPTIESETHTILTHSWPENLFIQLPRVDVVRESELKQAIVFGVTQETFGMNSVKALPATQTAEVTSEQEDPDTEDIEKEPIRDDPASVKSVKHVKSQDKSHDSMGFVIGGDVRDNEADPYEDDQPPQSDVPSISSHQAVSAPAVSRPRMNMAVITSIIDQMRMKFAQLWSTIRDTGNSKQRIMAVVLLVSAIFLVSGSIWATLYFFHKATLTVQYKSEPIEDTLSVTDGKQFKKFTETFTVSAKTATTGTQDIGDKASGDITIFNADEEEMTFEKGTTLETSEGLRFVLDDDVTVEAAEKTITDEGDVLTSTSKAQSTATAQDIGPDFNIKKDTKMTIDGLSSTTYFARATAAFTGGSSEEVQTVSKADYAKLDRMMQTELAEKSKAQLQSISSKGNIIEDLTLIDDKNKTYSKEIGEESTSVTAKVTASVSFYAYDDQAIQAFILKEFSSDIPDGYVLEEADVSFEIASATRDEKTGDVSIDIDAVGKPRLKIDTEKLVQEVKGVSLSSIRPLLQDGFNASGYKAVIDAPIPMLRSRLPWFSQNITVELKGLNQ